MTLDFDRLADLAWNQLWQVTLVALVVAVLVKAFGRQRPHLAYLLWLLVIAKCLTPPVWSSPMGVFSWVRMETALQVETEGAASLPDVVVGLSPSAGKVGSRRRSPWIGNRERSQRFNRSGIAKSPRVTGCLAGAAGRGSARRVRPGEHRSDDRSRRDSRASLAFYSQAAGVYLLALGVGNRLGHWRGDLHGNGDHSPRTLRLDDLAIERAG